MAGIVEGLNLLACLPEEIMQWHNNLTINASSVRVYPYYGNKIDRDAVISFFFKTPAKISSIDVLLVPFDVFLEDMEVLYSIPFQTCVVDDSRNTCKNDQTLWSRLLSIRCRMRLLLVSYVKASLADARVFLQFILPNLFTSRLKIMVSKNCRNNCYFEAFILSITCRHGLVRALNWKKSKDYAMLFVYLQLEAALMSLNSLFTK
jgi:hypothetical protein